MKEMNKYAFVIPTKDRPKCIEYCLETQGKALTGAGFDIIIDDSSTGSETKDIAMRYKDAGLSVIYVSYEDKAGARSIDEKCFKLCDRICDEYDYLWLCSDGTVVDIARTIPVIERDMTRKKELIIISDAAVLPYSDKEFEDACELCRELCWRMTLLGSIIVSGDLLRETIDKQPYRQDDGATLWLPTAYYAVLAQRPFCASFHYIDQVFQINPKKVGSFWYLSGNVLWQWGKVWCDTIDSLPAYYDAIKEEVIFSHDKYMGVFSESNLKQLKQTGNLTRRKVLKYRSYIKRVTKTPYEAFLKESFSPLEMRLIMALMSLRNRI